MQLGQTDQIALTTISLYKKLSSKIMAGLQLRKKKFYLWAIKNEMKANNTFYFYYFFSAPAGL